MAVQLGNFARNQLPRLSATSNQGTLPAIYQNSDNDSSTISDPHVGTNNESVITAEIVTGKHKRSGSPKKDDTDLKGKTLLQLQHEQLSIPLRPHWTKNVQSVVPAKP
eukprot:2636009-Ditylum_brightwellii.AAC.1